jgi:hypothetical protein
MTEEEQEELEENIWPIRFVLVKVSSSTKEHLPRHSQIQPATKTHIQNCPFVNRFPARCRDSFIPELIWTALS